MIFPIKKLHELFENNTPLRGIFSVYGDFGVGKTTFALQTAINAAISGKEILYLYSKKNLPIEIADRIIKEIKNPDQIKISENITFIKVSNFNDLRHIVFNLDFLILTDNDKKEKIGMIIIDSVTDLYRIELDRENKDKNVNLSYQINQILANLKLLNENYKFEILIVNEISRTSKNAQFIEVQSGGKVMDYWTTYSLKICRTAEIKKRSLNITKSPSGKLLKFISPLIAKGFE